MTKRDVVSAALDGEKVPYTPWHVGFTFEAWKKLEHYFGGDISAELENHFHSWPVYPGKKAEGKDLCTDFFGVAWDCSEDKDIGVVSGCLLPEPDVNAYTFPSIDIVKRYHEETLKQKPCSSEKELYRIFALGFSLFERAWTMRGMENLLMDFIINPQFARALLRRITDYNIAALANVIDEDFEAVQFGDDWGQQHGLIMGPDIWHEFIAPELKRIYGFVKGHGKRVIIHSCGDVQELFDDLIELGLDCFNPFQPEVMDVHALHGKYRGKLSFWGGLSTQQTLPYGSVEDVEKETGSLLKMGLSGNYIFSPAHAVGGDVPLENMLAFINAVKSQPGFAR
ncbi:MAG: uroporphyrinogen decarboxylase family protein [Victivallaceae bacterium]|nr:uroporphyrinogen decarboxylase family protein [Victivallaceae bacterium]